MQIKILSKNILKNQTLYLNFTRNILVVKQCVRIINVNYWYLNLVFILGFIK